MNLLWLQSAGCGGCSMSLLGAERPDLVAAASAATLFSAPVQAHTEAALSGAALAAGALHPLLGPDHVLALVAVGLWVGSRHGPAGWRIVGVFLLAGA